MKKRVFQVISWLVVILVAVLFTRSLVRDWDNVQAIIFTMSWFSWSSVLFFVAAVVVSGMLWGRLVRQMSGREVDIQTSIRIHAASWLLKYAPGQVGSLVNKVAWAKRHKYSRKIVGTSVLYENILMVFASLILSVPLVAFIDIHRFQDTSIIAGLLAVIPMLVVCNQRVFYAIINTLLRFIGRKPIEDASLLSSRQIFSNTLYYLIPRILNGIGFVIIAAAILPVTPDMYVPLASTFILAGVIGMLAILVPSGIGVREGIIVLLASSYFSPEQAIVLALIARFFSTIADIGVLAVYLVLNKGRLMQR